MSHTKGPWEIRKDIESNYDSRTGERKPDRITRWIESGGDSICLVSCFGNHSKDANANATLIAAAPDMLDALLLMSRSMGDQIYLDPKMQKAIILLRDTIDKATGMEFKKYPPLLVDNEHREGKC